MFVELFTLHYITLHYITLHYIISTKIFTLGSVFIYFPKNLYTWECIKHAHIYTLYSQDGSWVDLYTLKGG